MDDQSILALLHSRTPEGADALLERYGGLIHYVARGILNDPQETEECVSDVCLKLWQVPERFDPDKSSLATWLTAVTRNAALNRLKALQRRQAQQTDLEESAAVSGAETPEEAVLRQERAEQLRRALERLSRRERTLFYRKYYYLQSTAQIAAELGMSERAAEGRLYRLRQKLRQWLGGEDDA